MPLGQTPSARVESLESRTLLAGNVFASTIGGTLIIRGDALGNAITLERDGTAPGSFLLRGDDTTTVNGEGTLFFQGVTRGVHVSLGGGNDALAVRNADLRRDLTVLLGRGDDRVLLQDVTVARSLAIEGGHGDDQVDLLSVEVERNVDIDTANGNDLITLEDTEMGGRSKLRGGKGRDTFFLRDNGAASKLKTDFKRKDDALVTAPVQRNFDFRRGAQGWQAGFADFPVGQEALHDFQSGIRALPSELNTSGTGFLISGVNHPDDLFMFLKRKLGPADGITPGKSYEVRFEITFASNAYVGGFGVGGAPGDSVYLKAGATRAEPKANVIDPDGKLIMNVDKGDQAIGGPAASVVSTIGNGTEFDPENETPYVSLNRKHVHTPRVTADSNGELWLLVGTDSGFEATTALYYQNINATLIPLAG